MIDFSTTPHENSLNATEEKAFFDLEGNVRKRGVSVRRRGMPAV